ncbi:DNA-binding transcriptional activator of the SARP family [Asanoa hainanensis]|uniref:DNA-binding transcriptional activator of the SARP family n=1 Tax=Asanoa hainanensis TaxID=560556 RepID=A0A239NK54_9ACTN|nr:AfsR/SARP family transcriptional regulator [Asanoa hainanensis]SNT54738.1 DNA-binding transcriptional activator of the SARP family [Asanoa hainanensis]
MNYHVLGPLLVRATPAGPPDQLTAPKPRKVLALLLLHANLVVPVETLIAELWGDDPPASAQTTLQTYILKIRRMLVSALSVCPNQLANEILVTASGGYRLNVGPGELDLHEYERLAAAGRAALDQGDDAEGARLLAEALGLWKGGALVDVRRGPVLQAEVQRLEERRLSLWRQRIEADLRLDRHQAVLGDLGWLAARHPLNEDLQAQYMVALYRAGRRTDALEAFHRLRGTLQDDLGLEPSQRVQRLQHAILTADPALDHHAYAS